MRVVGICYFRNESDILEAFVRHTLAYCDHLILLDHGSTDASPDIVHQLRREGLSIQLISDPTPGHIEVNHANRLLTLAAHEFAADWILALDVDEFIHGSPDRSFLPVPAEGETPCLKIEMRSYYPTQNDRTGILNPPERITNRLAAEPWGSDNPSRYKTFVPGWLARKPEAHFVQGKHLILLGRQAAPAMVLKNVYLAHYSIRSPGQYAIKLATKQIQKSRHISNSGEEAAFYEKPYEILREGYSKFVGQFHKFRLSYAPGGSSEKMVRDPLDYRGGPLRYTPVLNDTDNVVQSLIELAERLARSSGNGTIPEDAQNPATLSIEVINHPDPGHKAVRNIAADRSLFQTVSFPLDCPRPTRLLRLHLLSSPGLMEIREINLLDTTTNTSRVFGTAEMEKMLRVELGGAVIPATDSWRMLVSNEPVCMVFEGWYEAGLKNPTELVLKLRFEDRNFAPVLLSAKVLNAFTAARNERDAGRIGIRLKKNCREIFNRRFWVRLFAKKTKL